ncbi:MAG: hypothetical protein NTW32_05855 [Chloroflexi bacterium]|nr:hypothetical protein [Chloroflexota bacterium]
MTATSLPTYCANHPDVETMLRCNRCDKPICAKCAIKSPIGYRCPECVKNQQKVFDTAVWLDYILGAATAGILSGIASFLISLIGSIGFFGWFLVIAAAPTAGMAIAEGTRFVIKRHRSRTLFITIAVAVVVGALPTILLQLVTLNLFGLAFQGIYLAMATPAVYTRLSGIQLFK